MTTVTHTHPSSRVLRGDALAAGSWIVLIAWLMSTAAAFWYFELSNWRPFAPTAAVPFANVDAALAERWFRANIGLAAPLGAPAKLTFVHLYNPQCRCNRFTEPHLKRLMDRFQSLGVRFLAAPASSSAAGVPTPLSLPRISSEDGALAAAGIHSAPAALLFDAAGRLLYYGPYSDSAWCGAAGALVDPVIERALSGLTTMTGPSAARGCFCEW